jgi:hypothetical protein
MISFELPYFWNDEPPPAPSPEAMQALGAFIGSFGTVEDEFRRLFSSITGIFHPTHLVFQALTNKDKGEILAELIKPRDAEALAMAEITGTPDTRIRLTAAQRQRAKACCSRFATLSLKRNRIVHAIWGQINNEWCRIYFDVIWESHGRITDTSPLDQKFRDRNIFPVHRINEFTKAAIDLEHNLRKLAIEIRPPARMKYVMSELLWRGKQLELPL